MTVVAVFRLNPVLLFFIIVALEQSTAVMEKEDELELEYKTSNWVVRVPPQQALPQHIEIVTKESESTRKLVPHKLNIRYGEREGQLLDIYGTDLPKGSTIFVYLHGGYWQMLDKNISAYPAIPLWQAGIRCVVGGYDLAPNVSLDIIVQEARELAVFILKMAKEENCNVWCGGHSAGAHLCASLLEASWFNLLDPEMKQRFRGVILISGVFDLLPIVYTTINDALHLGRSPQGPWRPADLERKRHHYINLN